MVKRHRSNDAKQWRAIQHIKDELKSEIELKKFYQDLINTTTPTNNTWLAYDLNDAQQGVQDGERVGLFATSVSFNLKMQALLTIGPYKNIKYYIIRVHNTSFDGLSGAQMMGKILTDITFPRALNSFMSEGGQETKDFEIIKEGMFELMIYNQRPHIRNHYLPLKHRVAWLNNASTIPMVGRVLFIYAATGPGTITFDLQCAWSFTDA